MEENKETTNQPLDSKPEFQKVESEPQDISSQPQVTQPPEVKPKVDDKSSVDVKPKKDLLIPILLILLLIVFGIASYLGYQYYISTKQLDKPIEETPIVYDQEDKPSPTSNPMADWQMFENTVYKYTIQYPLGWTVGAPHNVDPSGFFEPVFDSNCDHDAGELCQQFFIEAIETDMATDLEPSIIIKEDDIVINEQDILIDGQNAVNFEVYQTNYNNVPGKLLYIVVTNNNGFKYTIFYQEYKKDKEFKTESDWENRELFDQILSTFQFQE